VDYSQKRGWYLDLARDQTGERLLKPISFLGGGETLEILTQIPASGAMDGGRPARASTQQPPPHGNWAEPSLEVPAAPLSKLSGMPATHCQGECEVWVAPPQNGKNAFDEAVAPIDDNVSPLPARPGWWQLQ